MQVPVVMTSLGQKISTVAVQSVNAGSPLITSTSPTTATTPKVVIQTIPTVMPTSAENGEKITMQPAKIITIPATQLTQCQLQTKTGLSGSGSINIVGTPLAVRALTPVSIAHGTPVMRLSVPAQQASGQTPPRVISAVIKSPEVKSDAAALKQEREVKTLQLVKEEKPADGSKTVTHVVVVSTPSAIALPVTVKTEGIITCEKWRTGCFQHGLLDCYGFEYTDMIGGGKWMRSQSRKGEFWNVNKHAYVVEDLLEKKFILPCFSGNWTTLMCWQKLPLPVGKQLNLWRRKDRGTEKGPNSSLRYLLPSYTKTWNTKRELCERFALVFSFQGERKVSLLQMANLMHFICIPAITTVCPQYSTGAMWKTLLLGNVECEIKEKIKELLK